MFGPTHCTNYTFALSIKKDMSNQLNDFDFLYVKV